MDIESETKADLPLAVDLDGTLINSDLLLETLFFSLSLGPVSMLRATSAVTGGRANVKHELATLAGQLDVSSLPYNVPLLEFLKIEQARGREIALVSASDQRLVEQVAAHLELFNWCQGSTSGDNLKGERKAKFLSERYPDGFVYAGDSAADLAVWRRASGAVTVGVSRQVATALAQLSNATPTLRSFDHPPAGLLTWTKALRLHQWVKNALILIPLFLSGLFLEASATARVVVGFFAFGLIASGGYLFNDLLDLQADRAHPSKRLRPLADGRIDLFSAITVCAGCIIAGLLMLLLLSPQAGLIGAVYLAGTLTYSIWLKRLALLDLMALATLFTLRVAIGTALIGAAYSTWLLTFSMFFFFSMSTIKRVAELTCTGVAKRRGYQSEDLPLLQNLGVSMSAAALVIFVLYLEADALAQGNYPSPQWLWLAPPLVFGWLCRIWLLAVRGQLDDDPVVFALRDRASLAIGAALAFAVLAAHLL